MAEESPLRRATGVLRRRWRAWLRAVHRDAGYVVIGLTFIYAVSGLAINHIGEFDPNFTVVEETLPLQVELPADEEKAAEVLLASLDIEGKPRDFFYESDTQFEVHLDRRTIIAHTDRQEVIDRQEQERFFLRVANWLHYNRGKAAWTYIADGYAIILLLLATSGIFMLKGKKGLIGRGGVLIVLGILVPLLYVHYSGGPGGG